jgi:hypothetical protein
VKVAKLDPVGRRLLEDLLLLAKQRDLGIETNRERPDSATVQPASSA